MQNSCNSEVMQSTVTSGSFSCDIDLILFLSYLRHSVRNFCMSLICLIMIYEYAFLAYERI